MKRLGWLDVVADTAAVHCIAPRYRAELATLDDVLFEQWNLGEKVLLAWTHAGRELRILGLRHYDVAKELGERTGYGEPASQTGDLLNRILAGPKYLPPAEFEHICRVMGHRPQAVPVSFEPGKELSVDLVSSLIARYGVSLVRDRAVMLLDAVGFSLRSPLEQVMMVNSMAYSVNSAFHQLRLRDEHANFARTTTGDGFYIWNRARSAGTNIALYKLMMLILADNAVAQRKEGSGKVPRLRAALHIGEHYEFYQLEGLNPTAVSYIVGQVTVDLARLLGKSLPGQIVLGDFNTLAFVEQAGAALRELQGLAIAGDEIELIRCYLTGEKARAGSYAVNRYWVRDKHGLEHPLYNAKINIHRRHAEPIFLGVQHADLGRFPAARVEVLERGY